MSTIPPIHPLIPSYTMLNKILKQNAHAHRGAAVDTTSMTYGGAERLRHEQRPGGDPSKLDIVDLLALQITYRGSQRPKRNSPESRQSLYVHYIGAEVELKMLPLFSEFALLPYADINMTFSGIAVHSFVNKAKKNSIAMKARQSQFTRIPALAPASSTLSIFLYGDNENWDPRLPFLLNNKPDAIVGPNAGPTSYLGTLGSSAIRGYQRDSFPQIIDHAVPRFNLDGLEIHNLTRPREYLVVFDPFQRPGQRSMSSIRLPSVPNGFTIKAVGNDQQEKVHSVSVGVPAPVSELSELCR
ncbi:hypothetical protein DEU56DRAFT_914980 [Suillus clintonianus]|uniref:uncharacterized protein n=1 Tax=Suillus clintonianus TaxID=1904413 RepID=UPI001B860F58|nr:uncharacterized protein DEU56DRAFT_914980 [Suillus clintonianus]KAG2129962.1 hypothetical protein DEU56DRAFT_914980 [Suillus clintonianus]